MGHPIKHFLTITNHRHKVIANCARAGILWQGLRHDLSKYSPTEFIPGAKFFQGDRSPNEKEREIYGSSRAWMLEMPTRFLIEMFCDRVAASKIYNGKNYTDAHPYGYFLRVKGKHRMHENTEAMLNKLLEMLRDEGEEKTFAYIRRMKK